MPLGHPARFLSDKMRKALNVAQPRPEEYLLVYECERAEKYTVDDAFTEFNINHPGDYKAPSLSVSDVVGMGDANGDRFWLCDTVGWQIALGDFGGA